MKHLVGMILSAFAAYWFFKLAVFFTALGQAMNEFSKFGN